MLQLDTFNLHTAERLLCTEALRTAGTIRDAAVLLGITRHALMRRMLKHGIRWSRSLPAAEPESTAPS